MVFMSQLPLLTPHRRLVTYSIRDTGVLATHLVVTRTSYNDCPNVGGLAPSQQWSPCPAALPFLQGEPAIERPNKLPQKERACEEAS